MPQLTLFQRADWNGFRDLRHGIPDTVKLGIQSLCLRAVSSILEIDLAQKCPIVSCSLHLDLPVCRLCATCKWLVLG